MDAGEVTSISVLGRLVVFINSARVAKNLFEQTGALYMDRPAIPIIDMYANASCLSRPRVAYEYRHRMEAHFNLAITRYGHKWRVERRIIDQSLRPAIAVTYQPMQIVKAHAFLRQVLRCPENTLEYLKQYVEPCSHSLMYVSGDGIGSTVSQRLS